jgi:hypothetical protein
MLVRFDHVAIGIVNANHSIMRVAEKLCVAASFSGTYLRAQKASQSPSGLMRIAA